MSPLDHAAPRLPARPRSTRRQTPAARRADQRAAPTRRLTLRDGSVVQVRPIRAADRAALAAAFDRLGEESRSRRFGAPKPRLTERELTFLTVVDHRRHEGLVALDPCTSRGVAVARYVAFDHDPAVADVAVTVDDAWQRRGLGEALLRLLVERAAAEGIRRLCATVSGDNGPALRLARRVGYRVASVGSGVVELERELSPPVVSGEASS